MLARSSLVFADERSCLIFSSIRSGGVELVAFQLSPLASDGIRASVVLLVAEGLMASLRGAP